MNSKDNGTTLRKWVYRSAITGHFVTRDYAERNPSTTIKQRVAAKGGTKCFGVR